MLDRNGWSPSSKLRSPWRLETIFRNNVQTAFNAGRHRQMKANTARRPYWQYDALNDSRTRPEHAAQDGKVYPADHPYWDTWYPPNGHNCRCSVRALSEKDIERQGLKIETSENFADPDPGWDRNPAAEWKPDLSRYRGEAREMAESMLRESENA